jgi:hypothetical protein
MRIEVVASAAHPFARRNEPVRIGIPAARGLLRGEHALRLSDSSGRPQPIAGRALDRWSDGSIRWLLIDFRVDHDGGHEAARYELDWNETPPHAIGPVVRLRDEAGAIAIDTGAANFRLRAGGRFPFEEVLVDTAAALDVVASGMSIEDEHGACTITVPELLVEESNDLRAVVRGAGWASREGGERIVDLLVRLHFTAGSPAVQFEVTLRNTRAAAHSGGFWELGDPGSVFLRDVTMSFALPRLETSAAGSGVEIRCSPETGAALAARDRDFELYQDSSGGEHWRSRNHANRRGAVPLSFRGYRLRTAAGLAEGLRATPIVTASQGLRQLAITMPFFWQNFPKAVEAEGRALTLRLFPRQSGDLHELQGGEQKTDVFFVSFAADPVSDIPLAWAREPLLARAVPSYYAGTGAVSYLITRADDPHAAYCRLADAAIEGADTFERKREAIDEYGWRHFGDVYADHEAVQPRQDGPLISHYNNQYDAVAGCAFQFLRSADIRWWRLFTTLAKHVVDIDLYHTDRDKAAYNHGLFWHTFHYVDVGLATHRSYPRAQGVWGGGPSPEHNYADGLLLHHCLTGDAASREAVVDLAGWVLAMDDGDRTVFRWLARGATGLASATHSASYHGPGRGAGNSIKVLLDAHQLTRNAAFLDKAEALIRRCIHPADDIAARELLDAERRWSYTIFLHALGRYLDYKAELQQIDRMFDYARASLLAYTRWMADHEYPYLDHPEKLEFPTETWAAQELWKSEVFLFGAVHADGDQRARFLERSTFFFSYAVRTLTDMQTSTLARPMMLLLSHGHMAGFFARRPDALLPCETRTDAEFGQPTAFVPQKEQARKRAVALAALGLAFVIGVAVLLVWAG